MEHIVIPISSADKELRARVLEKVKLVYQKDHSHEGRWEEIYEDLSEAEYFVLYGGYLHQIVGSVERADEDRWEDYRHRMRELEKECDKILN